MANTTCPTVCVQRCIPQKIQGHTATMPMVPVALCSRASRVLLHNCCQEAAHLWRVLARDCGATLSMPRPHPGCCRLCGHAEQCIRMGGILTPKCHCTNKHPHLLPRCTSNRMLRPISTIREFAQCPCKVRLPEILCPAKLP